MFVFFCWAQALAVFLGYHLVRGAMGSAGAAVSMACWSPSSREVCGLRFPGNVDFLFYFVFLSFFFF